MWSRADALLFRFRLHLAGLTLALPLSAAVKVGDVFPAWSAHAIEGAVPDTAGKVVMVDFWASWCAPCKASFPVYAALQRELADRGLVVVAVSVDKNVKDFDAFVRRLAPGFATVRDAKQTLVADVTVPVMPTSYLIDRQGFVRFVHTGYHGESTARELRRDLELLLEEKT